MQSEKAHRMQLERPSERLTEKQIAASFSLLPETSKENPSIKCNGKEIPDDFKNVITMLYQQGALG